MGPRELIGIGKPVSILDLWLDGRADLHIHAGTRPIPPTVETKYLCALFGPDRFVGGPLPARHEINYSADGEIKVERPHSGGLDRAVLVSIRKVVKSKEGMAVGPSLTQQVGLNLSNDRELLAAKARQLSARVFRIGRGADGFVEGLSCCTDRERDRVLLSLTQRSGGPLPGVHKLPGSMVECGTEIMEDVTEDETPFHRCRLNAAIVQTMQRDRARYSCW